MQTDKVLKDLESQAKEIRSFIKDKRAEVSGLEEDLKILRVMNDPEDLEEIQEVMRDLDTCRREIQKYRKSQKTLVREREERKKEIEASKRKDDEEVISETLSVLGLENIKKDICDTVQKLSVLTQQLGTGIQNFYPSTSLEEDLKKSLTSDLQKLLVIGRVLQSNGR